MNRERLKQKEFEHAAEHLGAGIEYTGRPLAEAHASHPIMGGQFMRRLEILKQTLADEEVPASVQSHWIEHTLSLRPLITRDAGAECDPTAARERVLARRKGNQEGA